MILLMAWLFAPFGAEVPRPAPILGSLVIFALASVGIVTETQPLFRRALFAIASCGFGLWFFADDGWKMHDFVHQRLALWTLGEALLLMLFIETRLWRASVLPGLLAAAGFVMYLLSPVSAVLAGKRMAWLAFAVVLLIANVARRAMRAEDTALQRSP